MDPENIRLLDQKIKQAVTLIHQLKGENAHLRKKLGDYEHRIKELEEMLGGLRANQQAIEEGLLHAIRELDRVGATTGPTEEPVSATPPRTDEPAGSGWDQGPSPMERLHPEGAESSGTKGSNTDLDIF